MIEFFLMYFLIGLGAFAYALTKREKCDMDILTCFFIGLSWPSLLGWNLGVVCDMANDDEVIQKIDATEIEE